MNIRFDVKIFFLFSLILLSSFTLASSVIGLNSKEKELKKIPHFHLNGSEIISQNGESIVLDDNYSLSLINLSIDGKDIRDYKLHDLRKQMGIVTQDAILFNDSIFNNIALGIEDPDPEKVIEAAKIANAHEFITKFDAGYEHNIGDGGHKLSGGQ